MRVIDDGPEISISCSIMAHPRRKGLAEALASELGVLSPVIAYDPAPLDPPSAMRTAALAWRAYSPDASHHLVVQDDVVLSANFVPSLKNAIRLQPDRVFNLWSDWSSLTGQAVRLASYAECNWAPVSDRSVVALAVVMPTSMVPDFLDYLPHHQDDRDSGALYEFLRLRRERALTTVPSLVQHDDPYLPSLWRRNVDQGPRRAACFVNQVEANMLRNSDVVRFGTLAYLPLNRVSAHVARVSSLADSVEMLPGIECLGVLGIDGEEIARRYYEEVRDQATDALSLVSDAHVFQVWLSAVLSGYDFGANYAFDVDDGRSCVSASHSSLLVGALKRILPVEKLDELGASDTRWISGGLRLGIDVFRKSNSVGRVPGLLGL